MSTEKSPRSDSPSTPSGAGNAATDAAIMIIAGKDRESVVRGLMDKGADRAQAELAADGAFTQLLQMKEREKVSAVNLITGLIAGSVTAVIGAAAWIALAYFTEREFGLAAWALGALAGFMVRLAAGGRRARSLQIVASICAFGVIALAKGSILLLAFAGTEPGEVFAWTEVVGGFDLLWSAFAVMTAWRMLRPSGISFVPGGGWEHLSPPPVIG